MPHEGQELEGPNGITLRFVQITDEVLEMEQTYGGEGPLPPTHLHPTQDERFEVPAGTAHQMGGDGAARIKWEVRPALRSAHLFEELYTAAAASDPAAFLERYADEFQLVAPA